MATFILILAAAIERGGLCSMHRFERSTSGCAMALVTAIRHDCTADSLHVGSPVGIMLCGCSRAAAQTDRADGRRNDAASADPRKDEARRLLDDTEIARNMAESARLSPSYRVWQRTERRRHGQQRRLARRVALHPLLRDIGRHSSVNRMLNRTVCGCGSSATNR